MSEFKDYRILEKLTSTKESNIYRCKKEDEQSPVIIKALRTKFPSPVEIGRFKQEYEIIRGLNIKGIINVLDLIELDDGMALVLEDFGARSLKNHIDEKKPFGLNLILNISIDLAETLGHLHQHGVVHKDIKPHNILLNIKTGDVRITDFGIAAELTHENVQIYSPDNIEGTLPYMSPEQTGRMNRSVDYRTDLYSLGISLYEVLTGKRPFDSTDPLEMIHFHIAKTPASPIELNPDIPEAVSDIIMKLMSKNVEDRYQNGFGLMADFRECLNQWNEKGRIDRFELGRKDFINKFILPDKLFGREDQIEQLISAFETVCDQSESEIHGRKGVRVVMVSGLSGIGKSALINEINKPIVARKGYFIEGKYVQLRRDVPYSAIIFAFKGLIRQILSESGEKVGHWKQNLLKALGPNGRVITDIIPDVELIIGEQPPLSDLGPDESRNRFNHVFENFIATFPSDDHPLVLFLDDLQWADLASLSLIKNIVTGAHVTNLLLIGAYRDNEVSSTHPLTEVMGVIEKKGIGIDEITLTPLSLDHVADFTMDSLHCSKEEALPLANIVFQKTGGNPFFIRRFFHTLYDENHLSFDPVKGWTWDINRIKGMMVTENIVELVSEKIKTLPPSTRDVLKISAIFGNEFDIETLAVIMEKSIDEVLKYLKEAVDEDLVGISKNRYIFQHDRIYEAAYSLIPESEKASLHYQVGKITLKRTPPSKWHKKLFYIVDQLNYGTELIKDPKEIIELIRLNVIAGKKAKASAAYDPAFRYLSTGTALLRKIKDSWTTHYPLNLELYTEAVEVAYLGGSFDQMESWAGVVMENAKTTLDQVNIFETKILAYNAQHQYLEAIDIALSILKRLGVRLPRNPNQLKVILGLIKTKLTLVGKKPEDCIDLPEMVNPNALSAMRILGHILSATYLASPDLYPLVVFQLIQLSVKYGNAPESVFSYVVYGLILCGVLKDIDTGYRFGNIGLDLMEKRGARKYKAMTILLYNVFVRHWKEHPGETLSPLRKGYQIGRDTGDLEYAGFNLYVYDMHSLNMGRNLAELEKEATAFNQTIHSLNQEPVFNLNSITLQAVLNLLNKNDNPCSFNGAAYNEDERLKTQLAANDYTGLSSFFTTKLSLVYLFEDYETALSILPSGERYIEGTLSTIWQVVFYFYDSLVRLAVFQDVPKSKQKRFMKKVEKNQKKLKKWADFSEYFCLHKYDLVEAEKARALGQYDRAIDNYEKSIDMAGRHGYIHEEALANELLAKCYSALNKPEIAGLYMQKAYFRYSRWGAVAKLELLKKKYGELISFQNGPYDKDTHSTQTGSKSNVLDYATIMQASQAITAEIVLENLLVQLLKLAFKNAGSDKGFIILPKKGNLLVEAGGELNKKEISVLKSIPLDQCTDLSSAIIHYVARKKEAVILNDAVNEGDYREDAYVRSAKPKSILCVPVIRQGRLIAIVYLENNLTTNAFTSERVEVLNILSSQIAISIDNARLYENLEEKVRERTDELNQTLMEVKKANDHILESIRYSSLIQGAMLPKPEKVKTWLPDSFFIWKPRDIVGGDIYFYEPFDEGIIIALIDCTGHGVPGAFMTMLVCSSLHRIVREERIFKPAAILSRLNEIIKTSLHQNTKQDRFDDGEGLDAAICFIDPKTKTLTFSGANMHLISVENSSLSMIKGDRQDIGYISSDISYPFTTHTIPYPNTVFYMTTDGFIDQLGGHNRRRFGSHRFKELILTHHTRPFDEQKQIFTRAWEDHKQDYSQTDDITVTGFKVPEV